jgi:hypothetical protein
MNFFFFLFTKLRGPASNQVFPELNKNDYVEEVYGNIAGQGSQIVNSIDQLLAINMKKKAGIQAIPRVHWPTREIKPISEFSQIKIYCLAFPWLFPGGIGDIKDHREFEMEASEWVQHLLFYEDGRFAKDKLWCFFMLNYIYRHQNFNQSQWFVKEFNGNSIPTMEQLQSLFDNGDDSFIEKLMYFGKIIPGTAAYWRSKKAELYSWINHHVEQGRGAPSVFITLSCAEYFWPDIKCLLEEFILLTENRKVDLENNPNLLHQLLNDLSLIIQDYFHKSKRLLFF